MLRQPAKAVGRRQEAGDISCDEADDEKEATLHPTTPRNKSGLFFLLVLIATFGSLRGSISFQVTPSTTPTAAVTVVVPEQEGPATTTKQLEIQRGDTKNASITKEIQREHQAGAFAADIDASHDRLLVIVQIGRGFIISIAEPFYCDRAYKNNPVQHEKCLQTYDASSQVRRTRDENVLGNLQVVIQGGRLEPPTSFVVVIQNPIDRVVASYRAMHPGNCQGSAFACNHLPPRMLFDVCFPNAAMENFAQASLPNYLVPHFSKEQNLTVEQKCQCRSLARAVLRGESKELLFPDMRFNYQDNAKETYQKYPNAKVFLIREEHQQEDIASLDKTLGGSGKNLSLLRTINAGKPDTSKFVPSPLSGEATKKLCCVLHEEVDLYLDLFDRALNLSPRDKQEAETRLREQCGMHPDNGWDGWRRNCLERFKEPPWSKCVPLVTYAV